MLRLWREDFVTRMVRLSGGWMISGREGDSYDLRSLDLRTVRYVHVRHQPAAYYVKFQAALPIRFPLDKTPDGLFARLLLRNVGLSRCHWNIELYGSAEALPYLVGQWPVPGMTPQFFGSVCSELSEEILAFHQEIRDKFTGGVAASIRPAPDRPNPADVRFIEPVRHLTVKRTPPPAWPQLGGRP